CQNYSDSPWTF
nr:immunoglobulin light chain junction region [Macaca mulatta]